jgi:hypothetical protein
MPFLRNGIFPHCTKREGKSAAIADVTTVAKCVLILTEKKFGRDRPSIATALNNLAGLYESQGLRAKRSGFRNFARSSTKKSSQKTSFRRIML